MPEVNPTVPHLRLERNEGGVVSLHLSGVWRISNNTAPANQMLVEIGQIGSFSRLVLHGEGVSS
mgnify:FL=1